MLHPLNCKIQVKNGHSIYAGHKHPEADRQEAKMKAEDEIHKKLAALEKSLKESEESAPKDAIAKKSSSTKLVTADDEKESLNSDLQVLGGVGLLVVGALMVLHHIQIGTGFMHIMGFGGGGAGFIILAVIVGIGIMFYDYKNKLGWLLAGGGMAVLLFVLLSQLTMYFAHISLLGFILMFLPLAIGGALLAKGMKVRNRLENKAK